MKTLFPALVLVAFCGCGTATTPPTTAAPTNTEPPAQHATKTPAVPKPQPSPPPEPPKQDPKLAAFKAKVAHFLSEARAGAKLLTAGPSLSEARAKASHIKDLYSRLPDAPREIDPSGDVAKNLKQINAQFGAGELAVKLSDDFVRLKSKDGIKKAHETCLKIAAEIRKLADEVERFCGLAP